MQALGSFVHAPTGATFNICVLNSPEMKNRAFALLHRKYIEEAKVPWDFPKDNPSNIRVEKRVVNGVDNVPVLVDAFEHTALICGIISVSDGELVGTSRVLRRSDMANRKLELELYDAFPIDLCKKVDDEKIDIELNRMAIDGCLKGMSSIYLTYSVMLSTFCNHKKVDNGKAIFTLNEGVLEKFKSISIGVGAEVQGSFKYSDNDPATVTCVFCSTFQAFLVSHVLALRSLTFPIPRVLVKVLAITRVLAKVARIVGRIYSATLKNPNFKPHHA